jgi:CTP:molybdopterin cytidylyltransferase MocA
MDHSSSSDFQGHAVSAIVLAAGLSRRMGWFKLTLPWGGRTVVAHVVTTLEEAGLRDIIAVTGHRADEVAMALAETPARCVFNAGYADGEMLSSVQAGVHALRTDSAAALLCLGDQPQIEAGTVRAVLAAAEATGWERIVIPSFHLRAGHPILLPRWIWPEVLACKGTLRDVMAAHREQTSYLTVETPSVLADLDTPEDYTIAKEPLMMSHPLVTQLRFTRSELVRCLQGVSDEDARRRIDPMNCISWIVGHLAAQENAFWVLAAQGQRIVPGLNDLVGYGKPASTPPLDEMWAAWRTITAAADRYLDTLTPELLQTHLEWQGKPYPESVGTLLQRNIYHYWFHTGEAHAIRQMLGHGKLPEFVGDMETAVYRPE